MNSSELTVQIKHFKARKLKTRLAYFCLFISSFFTLSTLGSRLSLDTLASFLLILPLPLFFFHESKKLARKTSALSSKIQANQALLASLTPLKFSLSKFFTQPSFAFRLSLILLILSIFTTVARIRTESSTALTYHSNQVEQTP